MWILVALVVAATGEVTRAADADDLGSALRALVESGNTDEARSLIAEALAGGAEAGSSASAEARAGALRWLGRIEVADENWPAAMAAYERLADEFGSTHAARDAATEMALLVALEGRSGLEPATDPEPPVDVATAATPAAVAERVVPMPPRPEPAPESRPDPDDGDPRPASETPGVAAQASAGVLVGAFGAPFNSSEDAGLQVRDYLDGKGVSTEFEVTASQALRGRDAVVGFLLTRTRELGRSSLVLVRSRWGFREFISVECYSADGTLLWKEKVSGGRYYREETVTAKVMDRLWPKLDGRIGGPGLQ